MERSGIVQQKKRVMFRWSVRLCNKFRELRIGLGAGGNYTPRVRSVSNHY